MKQQHHRTPLALHLKKMCQKLEEAEDRHCFPVHGVARFIALE